METLITVQWTKKKAREGAVSKGRQEQRCVVAGGGGVRLPPARKAAKILTVF